MKKKVRKPPMFEDAFSTADVCCGNIDFAIHDRRLSHGLERTYSLKTAKKLHTWLGRAIRYLEEKEK